MWKKVVYCLFSLSAAATSCKYNIFYSQPVKIDSLFVCLSTLFHIFCLTTTKPPTLPTPDNDPVMLQESHMLSTVMCRPCKTDYVFSTIKTP